MNYSHRFLVNADLASVADFHRRSVSLAEITPPPIRMQVHRAPDQLGEGAEMDFTLWFGPLPVRWLARLENFSVSGFSDRQLRGPFRAWVHRHSFHAVAAAASTEVVDEIHAELRPHILWGPFGLLMWLSLPLLFAYRGWKTARLFAKHTVKDPLSQEPTGRR